GGGAERKRANTSSAKDGKRKRRPGGKEESNIITPEWESGQLEAGHPYGVKPAGNGLYESGSEDGVVANILDTSLGALRAIDDSLLLSILERLPPAALSRLSAASRGAYAFAHHPNLW
ncbi:hypothetical protein T484DRAFT_2016983, partial [Baffinella frigidus]